MMLVTSSLCIQAKSTSTLHIELTGGLGTAEIMTDEDITYPVDGGDDSFTFDKDTRLRSIQNTVSTPYKMIVPS